MQGLAMQGKNQGSENRSNGVVSQLGIPFLISDAQHQDLLAERENLLRQLERLESDLSKIRAPFNDKMIEESLAIKNRLGTLAERLANPHIVSEVEYRHLMDEIAAAVKDDCSISIEQIIRETEQKIHSQAAGA
jgi:hypothetical protein